VRPAVVLLDTGDDDFVAAPVTSRPRLSEYDLPVQEWTTAGLNVPSFIRVHKLTVLPKERDGQRRIFSRIFSNPEESDIPGWS
jgi:hypothetical protein